MTIDFNPPTGKLYFQGTKPSATSWHATFTSEYSNKDIEFAATGVDKFQLALTTDETESNWFSFSWSNSYNRSLDIAGYYNLTLVGDDVKQLTRLIKVVNSSGVSQTIYTSTTARENNEQTVYYR